MEQPSDGPQSVRGCGMSREYGLGERVTLSAEIGICQECGQRGNMARYHTYLHCLDYKHNKRGEDLTRQEIDSLIAYAWAGLELKTRVKETV